MSYLPNYTTSPGERIASLDMMFLAFIKSKEWEDYDEGEAGSFDNVFTAFSDMRDKLVIERHAQRIERKPPHIEWAEQLDK
jgi:hypothetical protein